MRILQIAPQIPFPQSDGGKVGIFNITKQLARLGHKVTLLALDVHKPKDVEQLLEYCNLIRIPHSNKNSPGRAFFNLFSTIPYNISKYYSGRCEARLKEVLANNRFDVVHVDHLHMGHYGLLCKQYAGVPIVLREHNVESVIMERYLSVTKSSILRVWLRSQLRRIRKYETQMAGRFDACCMVTKQDEKNLRSLQPSARTWVIPAGVEERYFESPPGREKIPNSVALVGDFQWRPNRDALSWFVEAIFPRVLEKRPQTVLYIIGKNIPEMIKAPRPGTVVIRGLVDDFREELQQYEMLVVPLRVGGGIRLKILESFAMRIPVVSTAIGCEGIEAAHNGHLLIADTEEAFAVEIIRLFAEGSLKDVLTRNANALVQKQYRWEDLGRAFEGVYEAMINRKKAGRGNGIVGNQRTREKQ